MFVPSEDGRKIGIELKSSVEAHFSPDPFYHHLKEGGHLSALHAHRANKYFARIDLENFFYSIARNRVARVLQIIGVERGEWYARWSSVKNPFLSPAYSLPYGFVQSPILASLVLSLSELGDYLREAGTKVLVSVYVDDIAISGNNKRTLERCYRMLRRSATNSNFRINERKSVAPTHMVDLFNCHLSHLKTIVTEERREKFYASARTPASEAAFERYCSEVTHGNQP